MLQNIWGDSSVDENNLSQSISALRKALDQRADESGYVVTLPCRGYPFTGRVEQVSEPAAVGDGLATHSHTPRSTSVTTFDDEMAPSRRVWPGIAALLFALAAGGYGAWRWTQRVPASGGTKVVLESFDNATGDTQFDQTLDRALQIDLEESPFVSLLRAHLSDLGHGWVTLTNSYTQRGEYPEADDAGEHGVRNDPHSGIAAEVLARAYERANRFAEAKRVGRAATAEGKDHGGTHSILYQIAVSEHDAATEQAETAWMKSHPGLGLTDDDLGFAATLRGKLREGIDDFKYAQIEFTRGGVTGARSRYKRPQPIQWKDGQGNHYHRGDRRR